MDDVYLQHNLPDANNPIKVNNFTFHTKVLVDFCLCILIQGDVFLLPASFANPNGVPGGGPGSLLASLNPGSFHTSAAGGGGGGVVTVQGTGGPQPTPSNTNLIKLESNAAAAGAGPSHSEVTPGGHYYATASSLYSPPMSAASADSQQQQALLTANAYSKFFHTSCVKSLFRSITHLVRIVPPPPNVA